MWSIFRTSATGAAIYIGCTDAPDEMEALAKARRLFPEVRLADLTVKPYVGEHGA